MKAKLIAALLGLSLSSASYGQWVIEDKQTEYGRSTLLYSASDTARMNLQCYDKLMNHYRIDFGTTTDLTVPKQGALGTLYLQLDENQPVKLEKLTLVRGEAKTAYITLSTMDYKPFLDSFVNRMRVSSNVRFTIQYENQAVSDVISLHEFSRMFLQAKCLGGKKSVIFR